MGHTYRKKLIEVALPLEEINAAAAKEKSIRHGHPSTLHLWWARRPLAACRAVLFASIIDDPGQSCLPAEEMRLIDALPIPLKYRAEWPHLAQAERRRKRLFGFIEDLVKWENSNDESIIGKARALILAATEGNPPPVLDPFAGGGSIPLEAQRLGLEARASDLNPVAVLINKASIEIPPMFAGRAPVNPDGRKQLLQPTWRGAQGLAEDVRYYGQWMRDEAEKRIGHLYPKVKLPGGGEATVIAWVWARTVKCPNPACGVQMPLVRSFVLSTRKGKEAWVQASPDAAARRIRFTVRAGAGAPKDGTVSRKGAVCLACGAAQPLEYVRAEGKGGRIRAQLMAVVAQGGGGRLYLPPMQEQEEAAAQAAPTWKPNGDIVPNSRHLTPVIYGYTTFASLFTSRQLAVLTAFSDLVTEARARVGADARQEGLPDDGLPLAECGRAATAYADAVAAYLSLSLGRVVDRNTALCAWDSSPTKLQLRNTFARQAMAMTWDFAEGNPFCGSSGSWSPSVNWVAMVLERLPSCGNAVASQADAMVAGSDPPSLIITDPPYYDNVPYADLSDLFYVWLRPLLKAIYPALFSTMLCPKDTELIADPFRKGGKEAAQRFFEEGVRKVFTRMHDTAHPDYPLSVIYAFKQSEVGDETEGANGPTVSSTGWETMLEGLIESRLRITGTWPLRSELANRMRGQNSNALASSIALVCRPRSENAPSITRREFQSLLRSELPSALRSLQQGSIAPVDLAQAAIGPGMAVFSRYSSVMEPSGKPMSVRAALQLINQILDEVMAEQEGWYDEPTRWAVAWYSQQGFDEGPYGAAEILATAKNVAVSGLVEAGLLASKAGRVKLLSRDELPGDYDPAADQRLTVWEMTQYLTRALDKQGIEPAGELLCRFRGSHPDVEPERARDLAYRLYAICDAKRWAAEARPYNALVMSWGDIEAASLGAEVTEEQLPLLETEVEE